MSFKLLKYSFLSFLFFVAINSFSQNKEESKKEKELDNEKAEIVKNRVETIAETSESEQLDLTTLFDGLYYLLDHNINLNNATKEDLEQLSLLNDIQINNLFTHIRKYGKLMSIYELQSIKGYDLATIHSILPFVKINAQLETPNISLKQMLKDGQNTLFLRATRILEQRQGYSPLSDSLLQLKPNSRYLGNQEKYYLRYRFKFAQNISWGITAEKDPGEQFFKGAQSKGFDFYSAHLFLKNIGNFKHIAIGDYQLQIGQGLTFWSGRTTRKSADVINVKRNPLIVKAYTSVFENKFLRGGATTYKYKNIYTTAFVSHKNIDGNILAADTLDNGTGDQASFSAFQNSGFHRTPAEIADKHTISETIYGGHIEYKKNNISIGGTAIRSEYGANLERNLSSYNQFEFNANKNTNYGLDYNYVYRNFNLFGEASMSQNGGKALVSGALITLDPRLIISIIYRNYGRNFQNLNGNAFSELSRVGNEQGLYFALETKLNRQFTFSAYFDQYKFPWLRSNITTPSTGVDYLAQLKYKPSKKFEAYVRFKQEIKKRNAKFQTVSNYLGTSETVVQNFVGIDQVLDGNQQKLRFDVKYKLTDALSMRDRVAVSKYQLGNETPEHGLLMFHDINFKPMSMPFSFSIRYALFDMDSYNARIYAYENDILYAFSVPSFSNKGSRFYVNLRYRIRRGIDLWLRYSQTYYSNLNTIGSGLNTITGHTQSQVKVQVRFKF